MRTLLLALGMAGLGAGCGRKAAPVAENPTPPKAEPRVRYEVPQLPPAARPPREDDDNRVADFGGPMKEVPAFEFPQPRPEEPKRVAPKPPVIEEEGEPVIPPKKAAPPRPPEPQPQPPRVAVAPPSPFPANRLESQPTQPPPVARRPVTEQDMKDIHLFVDTNSLASGKMPPPDLIFAALGAAGSQAAKLVATGDIVLTGTRQRESCWAFQKGAATDGGWIVTNSGAEQVDAATAKKWLGGR